MCPPPLGCAVCVGCGALHQPCTAGFYCPAGSGSSQALACGGNATSPSAPAVFCPEGAASPLAVGSGNYSTGSADNEPQRRTAQALCPVGSYCQGGVQVRVCFRYWREAPWGVWSCGAGGCVEFLWVFSILSLLALTECFCPVPLLSCSVPLPFSQRLCPAGRFGEAPGLTSAACSGECLLGYECPAGSVVATASVCPVGFYCSGGPKQACPAGRYSDVTATVSEAACMACPAGELCAFVM